MEDPKLTIMLDGKEVPLTFTRMKHYDYSYATATPEPCPRCGLAVQWFHSRDGSPAVCTRCYREETL